VHRHFPYIEACGIATLGVVGSLGARDGLYEVANVRVHPTGSITVFTGTNSPRRARNPPGAAVCDQLAITIPRSKWSMVTTPRSSSAWEPMQPCLASVVAMVKAMDKIVARQEDRPPSMEASVEDIEFVRHVQGRGTDKTKT